MRIIFVAVVAFAGLAFTPMWPQFQSPPKVSDVRESDTSWTAPVLAAPTNQPHAAVTPVFDSSLPKFKVRNPEIAWVAPTNRSRAALWIYKVVPNDFPIAAISNLMVMGSFTDTTVSNGSPLHFVNASNTCELLVQPSRGYIRYWNEYAPANQWDRTNHLWQKVHGVPSEAKAERLGLKFLKQFGIQRADLAQKPNGHLLTFGEKRTRSYFDERRGKYVNDEVIERGIFFNRRIDGVNFAGIGLGGGCEIAFGNDAKIADFKLIWRNMQPYERHRVASPDEIMAWIRAGDAVMTHKNFVKATDVRKLTITDCSPLYMGVSGEETQNFVYPFAQVEAVADLGNTNVAIQLYCPILSTNVVNP